MAWVYPAVARPAVGVSPWAVTVARCWVFRGIGELGSRAWSATDPGHLRVPLWPVWRRMCFVCGFLWVCARPLRVLWCHHSRRGCQGAGCGCVSTRLVGCVSVCTLGVVPIINHCRLAWVLFLHHPSVPRRCWGTPTGQIRKLRLRGRDCVSPGQGSAPTLTG